MNERRVNCIILIIVDLDVLYVPAMNESVYIHTVYTYMQELYRTPSFNPNSTLAYSFCLTKKNSCLHNPGECRVNSYSSC